MEWWALLALLTVVGLSAAWRHFRSRTRATFNGRAALVHKQHLQLFQSGYFSEAETQSARVEIERALHGSPTSIDRLLQPGPRLAAQIRALRDIGTNSAARAVERLLDRRTTPDALEQSWYWLDAAAALRAMQRGESLPFVLALAANRDTPLCHLLAAEAVCFPTFPSYLRRPETMDGARALSVLARALAGLRQGVQPHVIAEGGLGQAIEIAWQYRSPGVDPRAIQVFAEATKLATRAGHAEKLVGDESARDALRDELAIVSDRAEVFHDYLIDMTPALLNALPSANRETEIELLHALMALKADAAARLIPLIEARRVRDVNLAIEALVHSSDPGVGDWLCRWAEGASRRWPACPALRALRHFPAARSERVLLDATRTRSRAVRLAALGSLGWWSPVQREQVLDVLCQARYETDSCIARAAQAALARLGERHALRWFRQQLAGDMQDPIHRTIQLIAEEGIMLLWPDLDELADTADQDVAYHACEALEQLRENVRA